MARSMPWVCSDRLRRFLSLAAGLWMSSSAVAQTAPSWSSAVFPIAEFQAYTSHYGLRPGVDGQMRPHRGLDIAAPLGSPVLSWWSGDVVERILDDSCGVGVLIRSGAYDHIYCHLQAPLLQPGQRVRAGQLIGRVGLTGRTTGPHLHWGVRYRGRWVDPTRILKAMIRQRRADGASGD